MNPKKALQLLTNLQFVGAVLRHRVAAAVEHRPAIRYTAAATLIDVGANKGQFSLAFRTLRPDASITAFEPLPDAADRFAALFAGDARCSLQRVALFDAAGEAEFHVTDRSDSSSLFEPGEGAAQAFGVHNARTIRVPVKRLDECVALSSLERPILIKIDVQGAELGVLKGCADLELADFIYVELSFVELYGGQPLYGAIAEYLAGRGFEIAGVFNQTMTERFGPTQADFLFKRTAARS